MANRGNNFFSGKELKLKAMRRHAMFAPSIRAWDTFCDGYWIKQTIELITIIWSDIWLNELVINIYCRQAW